MEKNTKLETYLEGLRQKETDIQSIVRPLRNLKESGSGSEKIRQALDLIENEILGLQQQIQNVENANSGLEKDVNEELLSSNIENSNVESENIGNSDEDFEVEKNKKDEVKKSSIIVAHDRRQLTRNLNDSVGDITAPDGYVYSKDSMIDIVVNLKGSNDENLQRVTNIYGLRDKVKELLLREELNIQ